MVVNLTPHKLGDHPELPSFQDKYRSIDDDAITATYGIIFTPNRQRYLTGGIATQFYCPPDWRRGSDDVDVNDLERYTWDEFREQMALDLTSGSEGPHTIENPPGARYQIYFFNENHTFVVHICNWNSAPKENRFYFNIQFPRFKKKYFERMLPVFEREWDHTGIYPVQGADIRVLDPVDIINRKTIRVGNYYDHEGAPRWNPPGFLSVHLALIWLQRKRLNSIKTNITESKRVDLKPQYHSERTKLRAMCDSYDIRTLFRWGDINWDYFNQVFRENESRGKNRGELELLLSELCPEFPAS